MEAWNFLPEQVIKSTTVQQFEGRLDRVLKEQEIYYDYRAKLKFKIAGTGSQIPASEYIDLVLEAERPATRRGSCKYLVSIL